MIRAKFKCPKCGKNVSVKAESKANLMGQIFNCPTCHQSTPFTKIFGGLSQTDSDMHTHIVGAPAPALGISYEKTRIAQLAPISIVVDGTGRRLPLSLGCSILGRDSQDSQATIKIAPDPYMSRQHARLDVEKVGNRLTCKIQSLKTANPVIVNSSRLSEGQSYNIKPNDRIILGMTTFHLEMNL